MAPLSEIIERMLQAVPPAGQAAGGSTDSADRPDSQARQTLLLAWGHNKFGECCFELQERQAEPVGPTTPAALLKKQLERHPRRMGDVLHGALGFATSVVGVAAGSNFTLFLTAYGDVLACGRAKEGQLGEWPFLSSEGCGDASAKRETFVRRPVRIEALRSHRIEQVACGHHHCIAISKSGKAFEWGGLLPLKTESQHEQWKMRRAGLGKDFKEDLTEAQQRIVAASLWMYLNNADGQGDQNVEPDFNATSALETMSAGEAQCHPTPVPRRCVGSEEAIIVNAACGYAHTVLSDQHGNLFAAGYGEKSQLGNGKRFPSAGYRLVALPSGVRAAATPVAGGAGGAWLACGSNHNAAITAHGELYTWGLGTFGQLGLGHAKKECSIPSKVDLDGEAAQVVCGDHHTVVLTAGGALLAFGHRDAVGGQSHRYRLPEKVSALNAPGSEQRVEGLFAGGMACFAYMGTASALGRKLPHMMSWGDNSKFQLGRQLDRTPPLVPGPVALPSLVGSQLRAFSAGAEHCVAVLDMPNGAVLPPMTPDQEERGCHSQKHSALHKLFLGLGGPSDVDVIVAAHDSDTAASPRRRLGAHRCVLRVRSPALASRLSPASAEGAGEPRWELDLRRFNAASVRALLEYLYLDSCCASADVAAEMLPLARELGLDRLEAGIALATETGSESVGQRWVRTPAGKWVLEEVQAASGEPASASTYAHDLQSLASEVPEPSAGGAPLDADFVVLAVQSADEPARYAKVARPLLLTVEYFRAMLLGGFSESTRLRSEGDSAVIQVMAEDAQALILCLRMVAAGTQFHRLLPGAAEELLALLCEAHRLELQEVVAAAEAALEQAVAKMGEAAVDEGLADALSAAADLYSLPRLATLGAHAAGATATGERCADATDMRSVQA